MFTQQKIQLTNLRYESSSYRSSFICNQSSVDLKVKLKLKVEVRPLLFTSHVPIRIVDVGILSLSVMVLNNQVSGISAH